jgi:iron complex transport system substrate-binding protein
MQMHQQKASAKLSARLRPWFAAAVVVVASCGNTPPSAPAAQSSSFPMTVTDPSGASVSLAHRPRRIVSLSPSATETLFAINAGGQVVAVDDQSNYPATAPMTKLSGFQPNIEAIAVYTPDLVVAADDTGGIVRGLAALGVPTLIEPAAKKLSDSYDQIKQLGIATGHPAEADSLVKSMQSSVATFVASVAKPTKQLKIYHELDDTYYSATSATFIGQVYATLGLQNIADGATSATPDYPQLSAEYIVASNPDLIVLADTKCCHQDVNTVGARPGWSSIAAVRSGQVVGVDDDVASRWGPRVIDFMRAVAPHVKVLEQRAA